MWFLFFSILSIASVDCARQYQLLQSAEVLLEHRLERAGIRPGDVVFEVQSNDAIGIELKVAGQSVGNIVTGRSNDWQLPYYEAHIEIHVSSYRNLGFGRMLYLSLANEIQKAGKIMVSTARPSEEAVRTWESLVRRGLAVKKEFPAGNKGPQGVRYEMLPLPANNEEVLFIRSRRSEVFLF